ncbi:YciI family protein [Rhodococcus sp. NPDC056960]|uniref:YciI family protein n=1 Tax=Rhodococcus sp. NPDC056960 TaxID=3345982 RepID=UPI003626F4C2
MPLFALVYRYIDDADLIAEHRPEHRAYLRRLSDAGELVLAGPLGEPGPASGLLILDVESAARVEELADNDPFHTRGVIEERSTQRWTLSIGEDRLELGPAAAP